MENNKPYKGEDGKWYEADGTRYIIKKGEQAPWLDGKDFASNPKHRQNGRGKTSLVSLAKLWAEEGNSTEVTKKQLQAIYKQMLNESRRNIERIARDKDAPLAVTVMAESLLDPRTRAKTLQDIQVWMFGKEAEEIKVTTATEVTKTEEDAILRVINDKYGTTE